MESEDNLLLLVSKAKDGDTESFGKIYDLLVSRIYRFIYFRVGKKEETEDLTEEIFLKCWEKLKDYHYQGIPFEAWIFRIARNKLIDYYRTKKQPIPIEEAFEIEDKNPTPDILAEQALTKELVLYCLGKIRESYKEIVILKFIEEKSNEEISQILEKPIDQVRVLQSRALKALREAIEKEHAPPYRSKSARITATLG